MDRGAGKTTLIQHAVALFKEAEATIWRAAGDDHEQVIEHGVSDQLLYQSRAFQDPGEPPEATARAVGDALLRRVRRAAEHGPVLLELDDLHWCDHSSRHVLRYLLRRLDDLPVAVLLAHRPMGEWPPHVRRATGHVDSHSIALGGLTVEGVRELAAGLGLPLTLRAGRRLHEHTGGNPQLVRTLVAELDNEELSASEGPLRAPRSFDEWVAQAFADADPPVRGVVAAVAVLGRPVPLARIASMTGLAHPQEAVDAAVAGRLLKLVPRGEERLVDVDHALVRAAVEQAMTFSEYSRLHGRAANLTQDPMRAMTHRLQSCSAVDADLAEAAVALAEDRARDGAWLASARLLALAGGVLPMGKRRHEIWVIAAERLLTIGELRWAEKLLADVAAERHENPTPYELLVKGHLSLLVGELDQARRAATRAWDEGVDPRVVVGAAELLAYLGMDTGDGEAATCWAERAIQAVDTRLAHLRWAGVVLTSGWALRGDLAAAEEILRLHLSRLAGTASEPDMRLALALNALWSGNFPLARRELEQLQPFLAEGSTVLRATARLAQAELDYRQGRWDDVLETTESELRLIDEGWETRTAPMTLAVGGYVCARRGRLEQAEHFISRAEMLLADEANVPARMMVSVARGRVAMAAGDPNAVIAVLEPLRAGASATTGEGVHVWRADLAEAYVATGRASDAEETLDAADRARLSLHARVGIWRARGVLEASRGAPERALEHLERAVAVDVEKCGPIMHARARLTLGSTLRRRGQRRKAAAELTRALELFEALGAEPYEQAARQELELCALQRRTGGLTPAEDTVARLAVEGLTNSEIAQELSLSVKTVETHLGRVFHKLGVRHRVDLVRALDRRDG